MSSFSIILGSFKMKNMSSFYMRYNSMPPIQEAKNRLFLEMLSRALKPKSSIPLPSGEIFSDFTHRMKSA